jgi:hypothetical protein
VDVAPSESSCCLAVDDWDASLEGAPGELRRLDDVLEAADPVVVLSLSGPEGSPVIRRALTDDDRLRVKIEPGPTLVLEGSTSAIEIVTGAMRGAAEAAEQVGHDVVQRHAHIEYLGEDDRWRTPDSFPLVITSQWPESAA